MQAICRTLIIVAISIFLSPVRVQAQETQPILPAVTTASVSSDADDPAVWYNSRHPERSLILGTNKATAQNGGALFVFGLDGKVRQVIGNLDRPNNVDVEYGFRLANGQLVDIAAVTERGKRRLRIFYIRRDGSGLKEAGVGVPVFEGEDKESFQSPMGIALYKRPSDGAIYACLSRKGGPTAGYLWEYRLQDNGHGGVAGAKVREFGNFSGDGEIEAVAVDDELGYVYYADENFGIRKWYADPNRPGADKELAVFAKEGFKGDREGIAIYPTSKGKGYIVCTDQIEKNSISYIFKREGEIGNPNDHSRIVKTIKNTFADDTDGIEIYPNKITDQFPKGFLIMMNSKGKNFFVFDWRLIAP